ncbi:MAG: NPCBM/NEW2 domain-containing protein [Lachnospiraceae bacterium]
MKKILALVLTAGMLVDTMPIPTAQAAQSISAGDELRVHERFNTDWKFVLGNDSGAEKEAYDDLLWSHVALPHSFSIPYDLNQNSFYVGYGWYRKEFTIPQSYLGKRINLEFDGVFQCCSIYVNEQKVTYHEGGYSGFNVDITDYVRYGETNLIAVQVDNKWQPDLAPRGGDHQFSGGIYRDVWLTVTEPVHIDWYGTFVWTPAICNPKYQEGGGTVNILDSYVTDEELAENLEKKQSDVQVITEVTNDSNEAEEVYVTQEVMDAEDTVVATFRSAKETVQAQETSSLIAQSDMISNVKLWSMDDPNLYHVVTKVYSNDVLVDTYDTQFGFRSVQVTTDGFFLNGKRVILDGVNVHQDHGGWCDAVTDGGFYRDVKMIKETGFNFIRGSHYPHDTSFAQACDELGVAFLSEGGQWSIGGFKANDETYGNYTDWFHSAYPMSEEYQVGFDESCTALMENMIRMNRNHPSIIGWSVGNEAFFTDDSTVAKSKALASNMRDRAHLLDPTRKAGIGGTQRKGYNSITVADFAGGNGDGAKAEYTNYELPHLVSEYSSVSAERNDCSPTIEFNYNDIQTEPGSQLKINGNPVYDNDGNPVYQYSLYEGSNYKHNLKDNLPIYLPTGSCGMSKWCMFHHGSIGAKSLRIMGIVDYYRLPLKVWYSYREAKTGIPREDSIEGTATQITLDTNFSYKGQTTLPNDGSDDVQIIVTLKNDQDEWVNDSTDIILEVVDGPGVFPGGKTYTMIDGKTFMDGKGAIEFRSFYSGTTTIKVSAPNRADLEPATLTLKTEDVVGNHTAVEEPEDFMGETIELDNTDSIPEPYVYGKEDAAYNRQTSGTSSSAEGHIPLMAVDGDDTTYWQAEASDKEPYWEIFLENTYDIFKMKVDFGKEEYPFKIERKIPGTETWELISEYNTAEELANRPEEELFAGKTATYVRISFPDMPEGKVPRIYTCSIYGVASKRIPYQMTNTYLSDIPTSDVTVGWGTFRKDLAIGGNPITLGGKVYEKGIGTHADSEVVYHLNGKYTRFQATIGIDDETTRETGSAYFQVYATYYDEISEAEKEVMILNQLIEGTDTKKINISVDQVTKLRLVTDKNGKNSCDHTDWAGARLIGAARDISLTSNTSVAASVETVLDIASGKMTEEEAVEAGYDMNSIDKNQSGSVTAVDALLMLMSGAGNANKVTVLSSSNMTVPVAGETFEANVSLKNKTADSYDCNSVLKVYQEDGTVVAETSDLVTLTKGAAGFSDLSVAVPEDAGTCYATLAVYDGSGLKLSEEQLFAGTAYVYTADEAEENKLAVARDMYAVSKEFTPEMVVTASLTLPTTGANGSEITWTSDNEAVIAADGTVTRPVDADATVVLTATVTKGSVSKTYEIICTVEKEEVIDETQIDLGTAVKTYARGSSFDATNLTDGDIGTKISVNRNDSKNYLAYIVYDAGEGNTFDLQRIVTSCNNGGSKVNVRYYGTNNSKIATTDPTTDSDMTKNEYAGFVEYFSGEDGSMNFLGSVDESSFASGSTDASIIVSDTSETTQYRYLVVALNRWEVTEVSELKVYSSIE